MTPMIIEAVSALIFLIPLLVFLRKNVFCFLFAVYLSAVYSLVGLPTVQFLVFDVSLNLIPILPMVEDLRNTFLNILLFVPLGLFLPLLWKKYRTLSQTLLLGFCATLGIELLQLLTWRITDINDIIANSLGCTLGYGLFRILDLISGRNIPSCGKKNTLQFILFSVTVIMFFLQPIAATLLYKLT